MLYFKLFFFTLVNLITPRSSRGLPYVYRLELSSDRHTENIVKQENTALKIIYIQMQNLSQNRLNKRAYDS